MVMRDRLRHASITLLLTAEAIGKTKLSIMEGRLAVTATAKRISDSTELLIGRRDGIAATANFSDSPPEKAAARAELVAALRELYSVTDARQEPDSEALCA